MNVYPTTNLSSNVSFNGKIIYQGHWNQDIKNTLSKNLPNELAGKYDLLLSMSEKTAGAHDRFHSLGQRLYKVTLSLTKENSAFAKVMNCLHLTPRMTITRRYHSAQGLNDIIENLNFKAIINNLLKNS